MMTMSAASEDAVAPRAPIATPTSADGQRGRVVDAVTHHHDRTRAIVRFGTDGLDLVRGRPLGEHARLRRSPRPTDVRDAALVAGDHDDPA